MKKYILTETTKERFGVTLYQIKAVRQFGNVEEGDLGGWVEKEENLSHAGNAWVYGDAWISDNAWVYGDARVYGNARVYGEAWVHGDALVESMEHVVWFSSVGSENGTLTAYTTKTREIEVTRGCFKGTIDQFESAVKDTHGDNRYAKEYLALIQYIRLRFRDISVKEGSAVS